MSIILSIVVGGMLGTAINSSYEGRLSQFITGPESAPVQLYNPNNLSTSGWRGEHAGKWIYAASNAYERTGDARMLQQVREVSDYLISLQDRSGYIGCYKPEKRFFVQEKEKFNINWDLWNTCYILKGFTKLYQVSGDVKYLDASVKLAELMYDAFVTRGIPAANTGEHSGMASLGALDAVCDLYAVHPTEHSKALIYRFIEDLDSTPGLGLLHKASLGLDVEYIGNGKIYEMLRCLTGLAKAYSLFGETYWLKAAEGAWENIAGYHLTPLGGPWGGVGVVKEFFNRENSFSPYQVTETCSVMQWIEFNEALLEITHDGKYADEIEKSAYNALLAAKAEDGKRWVYYVRTNGDYWTGDEWSCCWSSGMTALEDLADCMYTTQGKNVYVNIISQSEFSTRIKGRETGITQTSDYAGNGKARFVISGGGSFSLRVHTPEWSEAPASCTVNGEDVRVKEEKGYLVFNRRWRDGDVLEIAFADTPSIRIIEKVRDYKDSFGWPSSFTGTITHHALFTVGPLVYASEFDDCYWNENDGRQFSSGKKMEVTRAELEGAVLRDGVITLGTVQFKPICRMPPYETSSKRSTWVRIVTE